MDGVELEEIATCPDEIRAFERYHTAMSAACASVFPTPPINTAGWHFINIPIGSAAFVPTVADLNAACGGDCILVQIKRFTGILGDENAPMAERRQAVSWITHFIGDLHQPLHAADRDHDEGGNREHVRFFNGEYELHGIWDNQIVARIQRTPAELASAVSAEIDQAAKESVGTIEDWAIQSYGYARDVAYKGIPPPNGANDVAALGQEYQDAAAPVVRLQIARAGVRLAATIQTALK